MAEATKELSMTKEGVFLVGRLDSYRDYIKKDGTSGFSLEILQRMDSGNLVQKCFGSPFDLPEISKILSDSKIIAEVVPYGGNSKGITFAIKKLSKVL